MIAAQNKNKLLLAFLGLFLLVFLFRWWEYDYNKTMLEKGVKNSPALIIRISEGAVKVPSYGIFKYYVNGKSFELRESGNFNLMEIGDTVLIEYAVEDHSVARVVDKYYMQQYKYLKKKEN